jgi:hypothetical protein
MSVLGVVPSSSIGSSGVVTRSRRKDLSLELDIFDENSGQQNGIHHQKIKRAPKERKFGDDISNRSEYFEDSMKAIHTKRKRSNVTDLNKSYLSTVATVVSLPGTDCVVNISEALLDKNDIVNAQVVEPKRIKISEVMTYLRLTLSICT